MVKVDTGNTVRAFTPVEAGEIFQSFAKCLNIFRGMWSSMPEDVQAQFPPDPADPESSALRFAVEIAALELIATGGEEMEVPEIQQAGFAAPVRRDFWGNMLP